MKSIFSGVVIALLLLSAGAGCSESDQWDKENNDWQASSTENTRSNRDDRVRDEEDRDDTRSSNDNRNDSRNDDRQSDLEDAFSELGSALEELGQAFKEEAGVSPVDYRELREVLPAQIRGMEKGRSNGERTGALGFRISQVEQTYTSANGDAELEISIVDMGGLKNLAAVGLEWLNLDVDRESDDGFERTRTYRGHPVLDKCERMGGEDRCEMVAYVSRRFVVAIKSEGLEKGSLENIMEQVDVERLEEMREAGGE